MQYEQPRPYGSRPPPLRLPSFAEGFGSIPSPRSPPSYSSNLPRISPSSASSLDAYRQRAPLRPQPSLSSLSHPSPPSPPSPNTSYLFDFSPPLPLFTPGLSSPTSQNLPLGVPARAPSRAWETQSPNFTSSVSAEPREAHRAQNLGLCTVSGMNSPTFVDRTNCVGAAGNFGSPPSLRSSSSSPHLAAAFVSSVSASSRPGGQKMAPSYPFDEPSYPARSPVLPPPLWRSQSLAQLPLQTLSSQPYRTLTTYDETEEDSPASLNTVSPLTANYDSGSPASSAGSGDWFAPPPSASRPRAVGRTANPALPRKFPCPDCDQKFARLNDQQRHTRIHSGECPFTCGRCGIGFKRSDARRRHEMKADCN